MLFPAMTAGYHTVHALTVTGKGQKKISADRPLFATKLFVLPLKILKDFLNSKKVDDECIKCGILRNRGPGLPIT